VAFAFEKAIGRKLPQNAKEPTAEDVLAAKKVLNSAVKREIEILLPEDTVESFDIGPKTIETFTQTLREAKSVFWNGPMGWFEKTPYNKGTEEIAKALAKVNCMKVVGGGDTVSAVKKSGVAEKFDHLSTGGGAVLEYLEGQGLPGINVLKK
jgi:phosphoglycerate kinase